MEKWLPPIFMDRWSTPCPNRCAADDEYGDTAAAVTANGEVSPIVAQISDWETRIASAVEEQPATTTEMSSSVQEAAGRTTEIAANIPGVSTAAESTTQALTQTRTAVDDLSRMASDLRTTVGAFTF